MMLVRERLRDLRERGEGKTYEWTGLGLVPISDYK